MVKNRRTKRPKAALLNTNSGPWFRKPLNCCPGSSAAVRCVLISGFCTASSIRPRAGTSAPVDVKIDVSSGVLLPLSAGNHLAAGSCLALRKNVTSVTQPFSRLDRLSRIRMAFCPPTARIIGHQLVPPLLPWMSPTPCADTLCARVSCLHPRMPRGSKR